MGEMDPARVPAATSEEPSVRFVGLPDQETPIERDMQREIARIYLDRSPNLIAEIDAALGAAAVPEIRSAVARLHSMAKTVDARAVCELCDAIDENPELSQDNREKVVASLQSKQAEVRERLHQWLNQLGQEARSL